MKKSHYQKSQLITNDYLGCELGDKYYRENNVVKMNRLLCKAMNRGHLVYLYEFLDNPDLEEGSIEMVFEEGYRYKNKVVRHSKVKVVG